MFLFLSCIERLFSLIDGSLFSGNICAHLSLGKITIERMIIQNRVTFLKLYLRKVYLPISNGNLQFLTH